MASRFVITKEVDAKLKIMEDKEAALRLARAQIAREKRDITQRQLEIEQTKLKAQEMMQKERDKLQGQMLEMKRELKREQKEMAKQVKQREKSMNERSSSSSSVLVSSSSSTTSSKALDVEVLNEWRKQTEKQREKLNANGSKFHHGKSSKKVSFSNAVNTKTNETGIAPEKQDSQDSARSLSICQDVEAFYGKKDVEAIYEKWKANDVLLANELTRSGTIHYKSTYPYIYDGFGRPEIPVRIPNGETIVSVPQLSQLPVQSVQPVQSIVGATGSPTNRSCFRNFTNIRTFSQFPKTASRNDTRNGSSGVLLQNIHEDSEDPNVLKPNALSVKELKLNNTKSLQPSSNGVYDKLNKVRKVYIQQIHRRELDLSEYDRMKFDERTSQNAILRKKFQIENQIKKASETLQNCHALEDLMELNKLEPTRSHELDCKANGQGACYYWCNR